MEQFFMVLAPLEMLVINLYVINRCSMRKYSRVRTFVSMGLFVCVLTYVSYHISSIAPDFGGGNGLFVFSGFVFFIPIKLLYQLPVTKIVTVACFSWIYTFVLFAMSVRIGYAFTIPGWSLHATVLLLQTVLYIATIYSFNRVLKNRFIVILDQLGRRESIALMWMTMMWFWTVFIFNLSLHIPISSYTRSFRIQLSLSVF